MARTKSSKAASNHPVKKMPRGARVLRDRRAGSAKARGVGKRRSYERIRNIKGSRDSTGPRVLMVENSAAHRKDNNCSRRKKPREDLQQV